LAANRASLQEVEHAQACFAVASAYAGKPAGPGPLPIGVLDLAQVDLASVTRGAVEEQTATRDGPGGRARRAGTRHARRPSAQGAASRYCPWIRCA
jgi:hypothetical protein